VGDLAGFSGSVDSGSGKVSGRWNRRRVLWGRLHRLHDNKRFVQVYGYVDTYVPMLARMYERRLKGYSTIGYVIDQDALPTHPPSAACP
jgi:hypothetical protein